MKSDAFVERYRDDFVVNGRLVPNSSEIMTKLAKKMDKSNKAVYLQMKRIFIEQPIEENVVTHSIKDKTPEIVTGKSEDATKKTYDLPEDMETFIQSYEIEEGAIFEIETAKRRHRRKPVEVHRVKAGWASKLALFLYKEADIRCKFDFKNVWISGKEIKTVARCECQSCLNISYHENRLSVKIENISPSFPHKRTYQLRGEFKNELVKQLKHKSALAVQTKLIHELNPNNGQLDERFNPHVPRLNAVRLVKSRCYKKENDPVEVLLELKDTVFHNVILAIGHSPFFVFYRTPLQLAWYVVESRKKPISISIDATGSVVTPPLRSQKMDGSKTLKHVFLYSIMAKTATKSVPIAQMLSQDQSSEFIELFFEENIQETQATRRGCVR